MPGPETEGAAWALLNLIFGIAGALGAAAVAAYTWSKNKKGASASDLETTENRNRRKLWLAAMGAVSLVGLVLFPLTQVISSQIILIDRWTIAHAALIAAQSLAIWRVLRGEKTTGDGGSGGEELSAVHSGSSG